MIKSLLCVQGPVQLIAAIVALEYQEKDDSAEREKYIVFFDLGVDENIVFSELRNLIEKTYFKKIFFVSQSKIQSFYKHGRFLAKKMLRKTLCNNIFDELYMAYLGTYSTSLFGNCYKNAKKICYGDSFGVVGNDYFLKRKNYSLKEIIKTLFFDFTNRSINFSFQTLILPEWIGNKNAKNVPLNVPSRDLVLSVIRKVSASLNLSELDKFVNNKYCIVLPSNLHQAGLLSEKNELLLYKDIFDRIPSNMNIVVKPHPRMHSDFFKNPVFMNKNIIVLDFPKIAKLPIEFFESFVKNAEFVVPLYSTSQQNLTYLYEIKINQLLNEELVDNYFYPEKKMQAIEALEMNVIVSKNLENWNGKEFLN